jgi:cell division protein FtsB
MEYFKFKDDLNMIMNILVHRSVKQLIKENDQLKDENESLKHIIEELSDDLESRKQYQKDIETDIEKMFNDYVKKGVMV